jgi:hypothetical protein
MANRADVFKRYSFQAGEKAKLRLFRISSLQGEENRPFQAPAEQGWKVWGWIRLGRWPGIAPRQPECDPVTPVNG